MGSFEVCRVTGIVRENIGWVSLRTSDFFTAFCQSIGRNIKKEGSSSFRDVNTSKAFESFKSQRVQHQLWYLE
jgi:hypothetical protein